MANNTTHKMNNKAYKLQETSYDIRQTINSRPIGVIKYNSITRDALLKRNIGNISPTNNNTGIGYISNLYSHESSKPTSLGEDGLLGYTHTNQSEYKETINKRYGFGSEIAYYNPGSVPVSNSLRWNGEYDDYVKYISDYFDVRTSSSVNFLSELISDNKLGDIAKGNINSSYADYRNAIYDLIQYDNIRYAMEKTRIGTITPNPIAAASGVITTNINNMSGKDTPLGVLTNFFYTNALNNDAHFNSLRQTRYITPTAYASIGNKLSTLSLLSADLRISDSTGRISFDRGHQTESYENKKIDDFNFDEEVADSNYARYINLIKNPQDFKQSYLPFIDKHYSYKPSRNLLFTNKIQSTYNATNKIIYSWNEGTRNSVTNGANTTNGFGVYQGFTPDSSDNNSLLHKTQELFLKKENKDDESKPIDTLIGRFHTEGKTDITHKESDVLQTAVSIFGMSHGRNLLTAKAYGTNDANSLDKINGYTNPYCRVWTYHHQYDNIGNLIRPFGVEYKDDTDNEIKSHTLSIADLQKKWGYGRPSGSVTHLSDNTVLHKNGFVNITPVLKSDSTYDIKKCMFSIENLAWKDVDVQNISQEQRGPNKGRIMWFPPYDLKFNENVNVNWNQTEFIGRGEKIYTYTNTERSGTLSFILLVDHPSILDAWKKTKTSDDDEQTLLRFFAGCEVLNIDGEITTGWKDDTTVEHLVEVEPTTTGANEVFYIFFPHNYSGKNDTLGETIDYLIQQYASSDNPNTFNDAENENFEAQVGGGNEKSKDGVIKYRMDKDTEFLNLLKDAKNKEIDFNLLQYNADVILLKGGQAEIDGIGPVDMPSTDGYQDATLSFKDICEYGKKYNNTSNENNGSSVVTIDEPESEGQEGSNPETGGTPESGGDSGSSEDKPEKEKKEKKVKYTDGKTITKVIISGYQTSQEYIGATGDTNGNGTIDENETLTPSNSVKKSNKKRNDKDELSERRYLFAKKFVKRKLKIDDDVIEKGYIGTIPISGSDTNNVSSPAAVKGRCVKVEIFYKDLINEIKNQIAAIIAELQDTDITFEGQNTYNTETSYEKLEKILKAAQKAQKKSERKEKRAARKKNRQDRRHDRKCSKKHPKIDDCDDGNSSTLMESIGKPLQPSISNGITEEPQTITDIKNIISGYQEGEGYAGAYERFDKEAQYFTMLEDNDTFLYSRLIDKVKYFSPAFHSITPEGFNARLAFLHQCTRQGHTYGVSDNATSGSAGNLAFGRPPICVLRIGDFYHTKIVIDSITIDYENPQWDMNPEGIGMQPMFARISLNFKFLGGSDIEAPIARLQNAVSFNYYANQSVYDDRADKGEYDVSKNTPKIKGTPWTPTITSS